LNLTGNYIQDVAATFAAEVGGRTSGQFDVLAVSGTASLAGLLELGLFGFTPSASDTFAILTAGSLGGTFANVANGARLNISTGGTGSFQVNYGPGSPFNPNHVVLSNFTGMATALLGDYNQNGTVDAADFVLWRDNLGSGTSLPNDDTPGVGPDDYTRWRANFGRMAGGTGFASAGAGTASDVQSSSVPEPASVVLILYGLFIVTRRTRGRFLHETA